MRMAILLLQFTAAFALTRLSRGELSPARAGTVEVASKSHVYFSAANLSVFYKYGHKL